MAKVKRYPVVVLERIAVQDLKPEHRPTQNSVKVGSTFSALNVKKELVSAAGVEESVEDGTNRTAHDVKLEVDDASTVDNLCSSSIFSISDLAKVKIEEEPSGTPEFVNFPSDHPVGENRTPLREIKCENIENEGHSDSGFENELSVAAGGKLVFSPASEGPWNGFQVHSEVYSDSCTKPPNSSVPLENLSPGRPKVHFDGGASYINAEGLSKNYGTDKLRPWFDSEVELSRKNLPSCTQPITTNEVHDPKEFLNAQISDDKPYQCEHCPKSFKRKDHFNNHQTVHSNAEPFKCHFCSATYKMKRHFNAHVRSHTGEKPFKCQRCGETFSLRAALTSHLTVHSHEEGFKCNLCRKKFKVLENLKVHMSQHGQIIPPESNLVLNNLGDEITTSDIPTEVHSFQNQLKVHLNSSSTEPISDSSSYFKNSCSESLGNFEEAHSNEGFCSEEGSKRLGKITHESGESFPADSSGDNRIPQLFVKHQNSSNENHKNQLSFVSNAIRVPIGDRLTTSNAFDKPSVCFDINQSKGDVLISNSLNESSDCRSNFSSVPLGELITGDTNESSVRFDNDTSDVPVDDDLTGDDFEESKVFFHSNASSLPITTNITGSDSLKVLPNLSQVKTEVYDSFGITRSPDTSPNDSERRTEGRSKNGACSFQLVQNEPLKRLECLSKNKVAEIFAQRFTSNVASGVENSGRPSACNEFSAESNRVFWASCGGEVLIRDGSSLQYIHCPPKSAINGALNRDVEAPRYEALQCDLCLERFACVDDLNRHLKQVHGSENPFKCDHCDAAFKDRDALKHHLMVHNNRRPYECNTCGGKFLSQIMLQIHRETHRCEKVFRCAHCAAEYTRKSNLRAHLMADCRENPLKCRRCFAEFPDHLHLMVHHRKHWEENPFKCALCPKRFYKEWLLKKHLKSHDHEEFQCDLCLEGFACGEDLKRHLKQVHGSEDPFKCDHCAAAFKDLDTLKNHLMEHDNGRPYECITCGAGFQSRLILQNHRKIHSGEKVFRCSKCSAEYSSKSKLAAHMKARHRNPLKCSRCAAEFNDHSDLIVHFRKHQAEKPFECDQCPKSFKYRGLLSRHSLLHSKEKPHQCEKCPRRFHRWDLLKTHARSHNDERPFKCDLCPATFKLDHFRRQHLKKHGDERRYECNDCGDKFKSKSFLKVHLRNCYGNREAFQCKRLVDCEKVTNENHCEDQPSCFNKNVINVPIGEKSSITDALDESSITFDNVSSVPVSVLSTSDAFDESSICLANNVFRNSMNDVSISADLDESSINCNTNAPNVPSDDFLTPSETHDESSIYFDDSPSSVSVDDNLSVKDPLEVSSDLSQVESEAYPIDASGRFKDDSQKKPGRLLKVHFYNGTCSVTNLQKDIPLECLPETHGTEKFGSDRIFLWNSDSTAVGVESSKRPPACNPLSDETNRAAFVSSLKEVLSEDKDGRSPQNTHCATTSPVSALNCHTEVPTFEERQCDLCRARFACGDELNIHLKQVHGSENLFKCDHCDAAFKDYDTLKDHLTVHDNSGPHECNICGAKFQSRLILQSHLKIHGSEKVFRCTRCPANFSEWSNMVGNLNAHPRDDSLKCNMCAAEFTDRSDLIHHRKNCGGKEFKCNQCPKSYHHKTHLKRHLQFHTNGKPHQCEDCPKRFTRLDHLLVHAGRHSAGKHVKSDSDERPYECNECGAKFKAKAGLKFHLKSHGDEGPYECNECDVNFKTVDGLKHHLKSHNEEADFQCKYCSAEFRHRPDLIAHLWSHRDGKPFKCQQCPASFRAVSSLKNHEKVHDDKKFECNQCPKIFKTERNLSKHMFSHSQRFEGNSRVHNDGGQFKRQKPHLSTESECITLDDQSDDELTICFDSTQRSAVGDKSASPDIFADSQIQYQPKLYSDSRIVKPMNDASKFKSSSSNNLGFFENTHSNKGLCSKSGNKEPSEISDHVFAVNQPPQLLMQCENVTDKNYANPSTCDENAINVPIGENLSNGALDESSICFNTNASNLPSDILTTSDALDESSISFDDSPSSVFAGDDLTISDPLEVSPDLPQVESEVCDNVTTYPIDVSGQFEDDSLKKSGRLLHFHKGTSITNLELESQKKVPPEWRPKSHEKVILGQSSTSVIKSGVNISGSRLAYSPPSDETNMASVSPSTEVSTADEDEKPPQNKNCPIKPTVNELCEMNCLTYVPYQCDLCLEKFACGDQFNRHLKQVHGSENPFKCDHCDAAFKDRDALKNHLMKHTNSGPYECNTCGAKFQSRITLQNHLKIHSSGEVFRCWQCSAEYSRKSNLVAHVTAYHHLKCGRCAAAFNDRYSLIAHRNRCDQRPFMCNQCPERFTEIEQLKGHLVTHGCEKPIKCNQCPKIFHNRTHLKRHLMSHSGEKPHHCTLCPKRFAQLDQLKKHTRSHSDERPFKCGLCPAAFKANKNRTEHMKSHSEERPYECNECGGKFKSKSVLKRHLKLHKEADFQGNQCSKKFKTEGHLNEHVVSHSQGPLQGSSRVHDNVKPFEHQKPQLSTESECITLDDQSDDELTICFESTQRSSVGDKSTSPNILAESQTLSQNRSKVYPVSSGIKLVDDFSMLDNSSLKNVWNFEGVHSSKISCSDKENEGEISHLPVESGQM